MKELTIEQKAEAYDEAIEGIQEILSSGEDSIKMSRLQLRLEGIFPELKESKESEDERIRKAIGYAIGQSTLSDGTLINGISKEEILAWIERQSEHLENFDEAEKEKSDFVGDGFIKCFANFLDFKEGETYWLEYIGDDKYNVRSDNLLGKTYHITPCQLYTVFKKLTWLERQGEHTDKVEPKFKVGDWVVDKNGIVKQILSYKDGVYRHTDGYSSKMFEDEWRMWDIIQDANDGDILSNRYSIVIFRGIGNEMWNDVIDYHIGLFTNSQHLVVQKNFSHWGIINEVALHPATKEQCDTLLKAMDDAGYTFDFEKKELKKIKQKSYGQRQECSDCQFNYAGECKGSCAMKRGEQPHAWSEEDEDTIKFLISHFCTCHSTRTFQFTINEVITHDELLRKIRHLKPQNTWKPSEEQMDALDYYANSLCTYCDRQTDLRSLYNDLKQL